MNALGLGESEAELLTADRLLADYFERALIQDVDPRKIANWMTGEFLRLLHATGLTAGSCGLRPRDMAGIVFLVESGAISGNVGKKVLEELFVSGGNPEEYVRQKGLGQISDKDSLGKIVQEIVDGHPDEVARFRGGERKLMGFFVGRAMKATQGKADPKLVNSLLQKAMES
jgi:aspartyl-tRNA(Asn)/glutamyl-tRNA(Gln) amidotransferase subunit B